MLWDPNWAMISWRGFELGYYPFFFGSAFALALFLIKWMATFYFDREKAALIAETGWLAFFAGALLGARLSHLLFYRSFMEIIQDPLVILRFHEGGLSSHGGIAGVILALFLWIKWHRESVTPLQMLDMLSPPALLIAGLIRIGNFFNQELVGTVTTVPWAVVFVHPVGAVGGVPRHPVQLYEALFYFFGCGLLFCLWMRRKAEVPPGRLVGLLFLGIFIFRFMIEFFKEPHGYYTSDSPLLMGQILSIPLIVVGYILLRRSYGPFRVGS